MTTQPQQTPAELKAVFDVIQRQIELGEVSALAANRIWGAVKTTWNTRAAHLPEKPSELVEWHCEGLKVLMADGAKLGSALDALDRGDVVGFVARLGYYITRKYAGLREMSKTWPTLCYSNPQERLDWLRAVAAALEKEGL